MNRSLKNPLNSTCQFSPKSSNNFLHQVEEHGIRGSSEAWVQYSLGVIFCHWNFLFSRRKASDVNIGHYCHSCAFQKKTNGLISNYLVLFFFFPATDIFCEVTARVARLHTKPMRRHENNIINLIQDKP